MRQLFNTDLKMLGLKKKNLNVRVISTNFTANQKSLVFRLHAHFHNHCLQKLNGTQVKRNVDLELVETDRRWVFDMWIHFWQLKIGDLFGSHMHNFCNSASSFHTFFMCIFHCTWASVKCNALNQVVKIKPDWHPSSSPRSEQSEVDKMFNSVF